MDDLPIEFTPRGGPDATDRLVTDLRAAILAITRLGIERLNEDIRSGGPLTLCFLESQATATLPELPAPVVRIIGALVYLVTALGALSSQQPVPDLFPWWRDRSLPDWLLEAERVLAATEAP